ncbi:MAG: DEAD/DEAH box helicase [Asgard group archaeon]|nr:DEAD/DEAH box helicase [Asgard group archaeon]
MDILHSIWDTNNFHLWMESLDFPMITKRSITRPTIYPYHKHPNSISFRNILSVLRQSGFSNLSDDSVELNKIDLFLPTVNDNPVPSSMSTINREQLAESVIKKWHVDTLALKPKQILDFLVSLDSIPTNEFAKSPSVTFWIEAAKFAYDLIIDESYLPSVELFFKTKDFTSFIGCWKAIITSKHKARFQQLANDLPDNCTAYSNEQLNSEEIILSFLNHTIDSFLRNKVGVFLPGDLDNFQDETSRIAQEWFESLFNPNKEKLRYPTDDFIVFSGTLKAWLKNAYPVVSTSPLKTCFKLEPPDLDEGYSPWKICFQLQAVNDPSLIIPASEIWQSTTSTLDFIEDRYENPRERLLVDLVDASQFYPKINESLEKAFPSELVLDEIDAYRFLNEYSQQLEDIGFNILLPSWWQNPNKIKLNMNVEPFDQVTNPDSVFRLNSFLNYEWEIAVGDTNLTPAEFEKLSELKVPFVEIRGKWIKLDLDEVKDSLELIKEKYKDLKYKDALQLALLEENNENDISVSVDGNRFLDDLITRVNRTSTLETLQVTDSFNGELRPYQEIGFSWLKFLRDYGFGACLADDMGLGKTIQVIAFMLYELEEENNIRTPSLLVCPTSIVGNWYREIERFAPSLKVLIHHGPNRTSDDVLSNEVNDYDLVITTYNLANRDKHLLSHINWKNIILDEAQNIKNPRAKQTRAIKKLNGSFKIALTGTPIENRLTELWSIMDFLNPGYLGSLNNFESDFVTPIQKNNEKHVAEILARLVKPFILRRLKTDSTIISDLPEKFESNIYCSLHEEQAVLYEAVVKNLFKQLNQAEGIHRKGLVLSTITKLKQICNHPAQFMHDSKGKLKDRSCKFERLIEMLEEVLANNDKALLFTQYKELGMMLQRFLEKEMGEEVLFLCGDTSTKNRELLIDRFQEENPKSPKLFILSIKAGGVGLNLTAANHVFHMDRWWNPAVENQATDRAFRIGQEKNVLVHKFICIGTLEESIEQLINQKKKLADNIISSGDVGLTELSVDDLRDVLSLRSLR